MKWVGLVVKPEPKPSERGRPKGTTTKKDE